MWWEPERILSKPISKLSMRRVRHVSPCIQKKRLRPRAPCCTAIRSEPLEVCESAKKPSGSLMARNQVSSRKVFVSTGERVCACWIWLTLVFHISSILPSFWSFAPSLWGQDWGAGKRLLHRRGCDFKQDFCWRPFLVCPKMGCPWVPQNPVVYHHVHQKKTAILGTPCLSKCIMDITLGVVLFWAGFFWLFWDHPFIDLGLFNSGIDINRRAWKWAAQGVRGRCLTCWERAVDRAMFELLEELTSWISACSPSGLRLPRLEVFGQLSRVLW